MVELFYKVCQKGKLRPKDVETNLLYFAIEIFDIPSGVKHDFLNSYFKVGQNKSYDYADYFLCRAALRFPESSILTIDKRDLPLALVQAKKEINPSDHMSQYLNVDSL